MIIPYRHLAQLACLDVYRGPWTIARGDIRATLTVIPGPGQDGGVAVWAVRGTNVRDPRNILRDLSDLVTWYEPATGWSQWGGLDGRRQIELDIAAQTPPGLPYLFIGHSLGAQIALQLAARFKAAGFRVLAAVPWACPLTGFASFWQALDGVPVDLFRFRRDPVPEVPWILGLNRHRRAVVQLDAVTIPHHADPIDDHFGVNYAAAAPAGGIPCVS